MSRLPTLLIAAAVFLSAGCDRSGGPVRLLNVSYDPTREFYHDYNTWFSAQWAKEQGREIRIQQSHGGSGKQARSVIDGLPADVVTLALPYDIDGIAGKSGFVASGWRERLPDAGVPSYSTIVFVVRRGNPLGIRDWPDLAKAGVRVITPNPKTSGGARWNVLAMHGEALRTTGSEEGALKYLEAVFANVPLLDSGARAATTTFAQRKIGDVLVSWENEAYLVREKFAADGLEIITPASSIKAGPPVAWVDRVVKRKDTSAAAEAYLRGLWQPEAQDLAAKHHMRPADPAAAARHAAAFPQVKLWTVEEVYGSWAAAQKRFFADGGIFDGLPVGRAVTR